MSTERKFIQQVAMSNCSREGYEMLSERLTELGYQVQKTPERWEKFIAFTDHYEDGTPVLAYIENSFNGWTQQEPVIIGEWNPDLFVAIAAMSEGENFWPGEWVWDGNTLHKIESTVDNRGAILVDHGLSAVVFLRKATVEEIITHFSQNKTNEPDFITEYKEQSFFGENISEQGEINLKSSELEKLSKALTDWTPKPFEPIWVWFHGQKKRDRMLFAFLLETTVFAFEEQYEKWSNFEVHEYKYFAKIDAPIIVTPSEIQEKFAAEYGVPASLIQIEKIEEP